ncbi:MAG: HXXEE domain-containing protein [Myxococcota bacterium]
MPDAVLYGWPYVGLALAAGLLLYLVFEPRPANATPRWRDPAFVLPLLWPMYIVHQFEEHGIDIFGRRYSFLEAFCHTIGYASVDLCPADPVFIFCVNAIAVWVGGILAFVYRRRWPLLAACAWGIPLVNTFTHVAGALRSGGYNPGLLTGLVLFLPMTYWMARTVVDAGLLRWRDMGWVVASGVATHVVLLLSIVLYAGSAISWGTLQGVNALNGATPLLVAWWAERRRARAQ